MPEVIFVLVVLIGQSAAFVYVTNHVLLDHDAGLFRSLALFVVSPALLLALPVAVLGIFYIDGTITRLVRLQAPTAVLLCAGIYTLIVVAASARWLWISLVALPRRERPAALIAHCRTARPYAPRKAREGNPAAAPGRLDAIRRINTRFELDINEYFLNTPGLPESFDGFSIVQITDMHADRVTPEGWLRHVAETACALNPDLIALTGDFVAHAEDLPRVERFVQRLCAPEGVWAIRGNHDFWEAGEGLAAVLEGCGVGLLDNRSVDICRGDAAIQLIGIEAPWDHAGDWRQLFPAATDRVSIVLSHTPDNGPALAESGVTLMLAGHHHGGQIRFPWVGSLIIPSRYGKRYDAGMFALGSLAMYVNRGIGNSRPAVRVLCRPEVARFVLTACRNDRPLQNEVERRRTAT